MNELRCGGNKLHGIIVDAGIVEIKCRSRFCGAEPGTTVIHRFSAMTGELVATHKFRDPRKGNQQ